MQVIKLVAQGTIEEKMHELQESKKNLIAEVIEPGEIVLNHRGRNSRYFNDLI